MTHVFPWILLVAVIHARWYHPRTRKQTVLAVALRKFARQQSVELALDKLCSKVVGEEKGRRESIPLFPKAHIIAWSSNPWFLEFAEDLKRSMICGDDSCHPQQPDVDGHEDHASNRKEFCLQRDAAN